MKKAPIFFLVASLVVSCGQFTKLTEQEATVLINAYYADQGCFSKLDNEVIGNLDGKELNRIDQELKKYKKDNTHKVISWELQSINGIMVSEDGNTATVDFTLNSKETMLFKYQNNKICGDEASDYGPWDMVAEFVRYDTGWQIKSKPKGR